MIKALMNMDARKAFFLTSGYVILFFFLAIAVSKCADNKDSSDRYANNLKAEKINNDKIGNGYAVQLSLTRMEYEERMGKVIDSLRKQHKKEMRNVERILSHTRIQLEQERKNIKLIWRDTGSVKEGKTIRVGRMIQSDNPCLSIRVFQPEDDSVAYLSYGFDINAELFVYKGKRTKDFKVFGKRIFRYGERSIDSQIVTSCGDSTRVNIQQINIIDAR